VRQLQRSAAVEGTVGIGPIATGFGLELTVA